VVRDIDWSYWTPCSKFCGGGIQYRYRNIFTQPQNGGRGCPELKQTQACNTHQCYDWGEYESQSGA
jgi:hypothetical protein